VGAARAGALTPTIWSPAGPSAPPYRTIRTISIEMRVRSRSSRRTPNPAAQHIFALQGKRALTRSSDVTLEEFGIEECRGIVIGFCDNGMGRHTMVEWPWVKLRVS